MLGITDVDIAALHASGVIQTQRFDAVFLM
jgi:hypothetical protein